MGNPVQSMTGLGGRDIAAEPRGREITIRLGSESARVGLALGHRVVKFGAASAEQWAEAGMNADTYRAIEAALVPKAGSTRNWRSSMAQDVIKGRRTEIEFMNGFVVARGKEVGVETPVSEAVVEIVREIDTKRRKPSPDHIEDALKKAGC
jgi:2-dehydropantoate 2-reductase